MQPSTGSSGNELPLDFDRNVYLELNPDVRAAGVDPAKHYLEFGKREGRTYKLTSSTNFEETLATFLQIEPSEQNAFDLFPTSWSSAFPGVTTGGAFSGHDDVRIKWLLEQVDVSGKTVLELGPLEAGHTALLERNGAKVTAIESNKGAFLRSLIVKNYLNLSAKFLLGDFEKIDFSQERYDLVVASGVLYHMRDPLRLLANLSSISDRLFIWSHYFEPDLNKWNPALKPVLDSGKWQLNAIETVCEAGVNVRLVRQMYGDSLGWTGFCGGSDIYSKWIFREDLLEYLKALNFLKISIAFDHAQHQNGPAFCVYCEK